MFDQQPASAVGIAFDAGRPALQPHADAAGYRRFAEIDRLAVDFEQHTLGQQIAQRMAIGARLIDLCRTSLRSRGGRPRMTDRMATPELAARWAASLALKRAGALKSRLASFERDFEPEVGAADGAGALKR